MYSASPPKPAPALTAAIWRIVQFGARPIPRPPPTKRPVRVVMVIVGWSFVS
jgi:hypothetical protein